MVNMGHFLTDLTDLVTLPWSFDLWDMKSSHNHRLVQDTT